MSIMSTMLAYLDVYSSIRLTGWPENFCIFLRSEELKIFNCPAAVANIFPSNSEETPCKTVKGVSAKQ